MAQLQPSDLKGFGYANNGEVFIDEAKDETAMKAFGYVSNGEIFTRNYVTSAPAVVNNFFAMFMMTHM